MVTQFFVKEKEIYETVRHVQGAIIFMHLYIHAKNAGFLQECVGGAQRGNNYYVTLFPRAAIVVSVLASCKQRAVWLARLRTRIA